MDLDFFGEFNIERLYLQLFVNNFNDFKSTEHIIITMLSENAMRNSMHTYDK